jgi:flavin reductase (DIM6/NTAB) family NADH-FMN oxidoreductase RutF
VKVVASKQDKHDMYSNKFLIQLAILDYQHSNYTLFPLTIAMAHSEANELPVEAFDKEALVKRNPHANFEAVQASRPAYDPSQTWKWSKSPNTEWQAGDGSRSEEWRSRALLAIDPNDPLRTHNQNYKLMISSTVPRPIALVSSLSTNGIQNLAPFSYFNTVSVDPPLYSVSFVGTEPNDSLQNVLESGECCISIVSDWFLEAANFTSVNTPRHVSEWALSGLHPRSSRKVKPPYVHESAFSIECKVHSSLPIYSSAKVNQDGKVRTATLVLFEAVMYHVREDAIDEALETVDIQVLRPIWRGGGITYGSCFSGWETERPRAYRELMATQRVQKLFG